MTRYKGSLAFFLVVSFALACGRSGLELGGPKVGGQALLLATNQAMNVGGHTYKNTGAGLVGGGVHEVYGDTWFDVDGVANALGFHFEGCAVPVATDTWEMVAAVTRNGPSCSGCPETIERRYIIRHTGSGSAGRYTFDAEGSPQGCGLGADLLESVLYE